MEGDSRPHESPRFALLLRRSVGKCMPYRALAARACPCRRQCRSPVPHHLRPRAHHGTCRSRLRRRVHICGAGIQHVSLTWLTDPIHDFRHERDHVAPKELPFVRRVWWALCLLNSPRGIGWSYKVGVAPFTCRVWSIHQVT